MNKTANIVPLSFSISPRSLVNAYIESNQFRQLPRELECFSEFALPLILSTKDLDNWQGHKSKHKTDFIFLAQRGLRFDSHSFCKTVLEMGGIFVGESLKLSMDLQQNKGWLATQIQQGKFIDVKDDRDSLTIALAAAANILPKDFKTIAVTGTNGKTSITQILGDLSGQIVRNSNMRLGTLGAQFGSEKYSISTPTMPPFAEFLTCAFLARSKGIDTIFLEATSQGLHQKRLGTWKVDAAIFSNISQDHLDYHNDMQNYIDAKLLLFSNHLKENGLAVVNCQAEIWKNVINVLSVNCPSVCAVGVGYKANHAEFENYAKSKNIKHQFLMRANELSDIRGISGNLTNLSTLETSTYNCPLVGSFQHENLSLAIAALSYPQNSLEALCNAAGKIEGIPGRLQLVKHSGNSPAVLVDYAHSPDSLKQTLETSRTLSSSRLICVFGCGGDRDKTKRPIMGQIAAELADIVFVTSDNPRSENPKEILSDILSGVSKSLLHKFTTEIDRRVAITKAIQLAEERDVVIIAGKGHEDYQIIGTQILAFDDVTEAEKALQKSITQI